MHGNSATTPAFDCGWIAGLHRVRTEGDAVACDVADGRRTAPPRRLDHGHLQAAVRPQRAPATARIASDWRSPPGPANQDPRRVTVEPPTTMAGSLGSNRRPSAVQLEVIAGQAHSYCSDPAQAEPASVVEPVDVAAGVTGRLGNPTSSRPTNSQCHRHRVLTRTSAGTAAPRGFRLRYREPARAKRFESLSMTRALPDVRHRHGTRRDQSRWSGATRSHQLMDSPSVAIRSRT